MPSAPRGMVEAGAPHFAVLGAESLGLSTAPNDLQLLPDGRVLVVTPTELAFGDGVRWETFRAAVGQPSIISTVAVDRDGRIYTPMEGGFARIDLGDDARWRFISAEKLSGDKSARTTTTSTVTMFADHWYWYGSIDAIISWRPGEKASLIGNVGAIDRVFPLGQDLFLSDHSSGALFRLNFVSGNVQRVFATESRLSEAVTCAIPFAPGQLLVGTISTGLKIFDGTTFRPFAATGWLSGGHRITDLCPTGEGLFAAAVDTVGIVFFDREGRTVQVLERSLDHRLAQVRRLQYASDGVLWALLNEGVARVEFPSVLSHFEPLLAGGLVFAQPLRHSGQLWILADGRAMRGIYGSGGNLERFEDDTPSGDFLFTLTDVDGQLFATNDVGIYVYEAARWRLILPGIVNARVGVAKSTKEGLYYAARGEYGLIQREGQTYTARRIQLPELGNSYNAKVDAAGIGWLELGVSKAGRLDPNGGQPILQLFGKNDGIGDGWVELYTFEGLIRLHLANNLYRFDEKQRRFVEDRELLARYPQLAMAGGRPVTDGLGRLWYTLNGASQMIELTKAGGPVKIIPLGFSPTGYTTEADGTVWAQTKRRLARIDLRMPEPSARPLQATITSVQFSASSRRLFAPGATLAPLDFADNSLVFYFAAPANPFTTPVTFEVMLEGAGTSWIPTGSVASAAFNRLKEGDYVLHVRPVSGTGPGEEARLAFTVRPPWFRTPLAWGSYVAAAIGLIVFSAWFPSFMQRRENARLERLVRERTEELKTTNTRLERQIGETTEKSAALSMSEERYRTLNADLERRVQERTAQLTLSKDELQQRELLFRLIFEHAPVGISWKRADLGAHYHFNPTFCRILELPAPTLPDFSLLTAMLHPADAAKQAELSHLIESGRGNSYSVEQRYVRPDGQTVWGRLSVAVVRDQQGAIIQDIGILEDITSRKKAEGELADTYKNLVDVSRTAGMAEVATGVLHNVGNVLNSLNVSATIVATGLRQSKAEAFAKVAALLREHSADLAAFLTGDPKGKRVPEYIDSLAKHFVEERTRLLGETESLQHDVEHIKEIVAMQQAYATMVSTAEPMDPVALMEDSLRMNTTALNRHHVRVVREFQPVAPVLVEKGKAIQILVNLIGNAKYACTEGGATEKVMTLAIEPGGPGRVRLIVRDNGIGIAPENITRIFGHGFTTKATGHGFGLHSSANAAKEMKGSLSAQSDGPGRGATFILELPVAPATPTQGVKVAALEAAGTV